MDFGAYFTFLSPSSTVFSVLTSFDRVVTVSSVTGGTLVGVEVGDGGDLEVVLTNPTSSVVVYKLLSGWCVEGGCAAGPLFHRP